MAFQQDFKDDEKNPLAAPTETVLSGDNSTAGAPGASTGTPAASPKPTGTGFVNLSTYLNANKDQSNEMANRVVGNVKSNVSGAESGFSPFQQQTSESIKKGSSQDNGVIGALKSTPSAFSQQPMADLYNRNLQGYQGPKYEDITAGQPYQDISSKAAAADKEVKSLSDTSQIGQQVKKLAGPDARYTKGQNTLDTFLTAGGGAPVIKDYQNQYNSNSLLGKWNSITGGLKGQIDQSKTAGDKLATDTRSAYDQALAGSRAGIESSKAGLAPQEAVRAAEAQGMRNKLANGDLGTEKSLGIDPKMGAFLMKMGITPEALVSGSNKSLSLGDAVSDDQVSGYNALTKLGGGQSEYDFSKSGQKGVSPLSLNQDKASTAKTVKDLYDSIIGSLSQEQGQRDTGYQGALSAATASLPSLSQKQIASNADALGLDPKDYALALQNNLLNEKALTKGRNLSLNDVAGARGQQFNTLSQILGIPDSQRFGAATNRGADFTVSQDLKKALDMIKSKKPFTLPVASTTSTRPGQLALPSKDGAEGSLPSVILNKNVKNPYGSSTVPLSTPVGGRLGQLMIPDDEKNRY